MFNSGTRVADVGRKGRSVAFICCSITVLAACERNQPADGTTESGKPAVTQRVEAKPVVTMPTEAVLAVAEGEGKPDASLGFVLSTAPVSGNTFNISLQLVATRSLDALELVLESDGLQINEEALRKSITPVPLGQAIEHVVEAKAAAPGLTVLRARLTSRSGDESTEGQYSIPILISAPAGAVAH